ncbi:unnamed protein product [Rhizophagus irregularis]|uniref:Uncharacterized protein n=1 Tax=Rhizophagus irregularis TaxID=588596 RepID=A0A2I1GSQ7_9GLOM|nr:hypothetical protein RhiirA4_465751 [Rhizophagus irregularis]CAB4444869.1 unnamed protein product [Rhizophagus irregularis]
MITYWKSNARKEFGFFGQEAKNKSKLNDIELIQKVTEALAESDNIDEKKNNEYEDNLFDKFKSHIEKPIRRTINGKIIPNDNVIVLIENIWIENKIDLSNDLILNDIDNEIVNDTNGRGILNYNVNDLLNKYVNENQ